MGSLVGVHGVECGCKEKPEERHEKPQMTTSTTTSLLDCFITADSWLIS